MRYGLYRNTRTVLSMLFLAAGLLVTTALGAAALERLSAEFQNTTSGANEISTNLPAGPNGAGGLVVYSKTLDIPRNVDVLFITFSGQGDVHNGSALLMTAAVTDAKGRMALCEPLAGQTGGGGGGIHVQSGWYTLTHLPETTTGTNCNNGGGGSADCHDNTLYFSCCTRIETRGAHSRGEDDPITVDIKLANLPGGDENFSFYERASIYIDGQEDKSKHGDLCKGVPSP